eukprot:5365415-Alexandrium_andersonii.AAC.1
MRLATHRGPRVCQLAERRLRVGPPVAEQPPRRLRDVQRQRRQAPMPAVYGNLIQRRAKKAQRPQ